MYPELQSYFRAEKQGSYVAIAVGILSCWAGGAFFLNAAAPFYLGLALPLALAGVLQLMVGSIILRRTDDQVDELASVLQKDPAAFAQAEMPRMARVMRNFAVYRWVEMACVVFGLALFWANAATNFWKGLGAGMFVQGLFLLVFDFFAEKRGKTYQAFVKSRA